jgi:eukaryotic-like serine/threonine-protein kinase
VDRTQRHPSGHSSEPPKPRISVQPGSVIAGKYLIERVLGQGGMGVVIAARHTLLDEPVAVKMLLPSIAESADSVERFVREARAASRIKSEHVVRVSDVGTLEDGTAFMVMELLEGSDLSQLLQQRGPLPVADAIDYVLQACEALADAHVMGIVHRDLKPGNLFLSHRRDGSPLVKVLDFGISKFAGGASAGAPMSMTATSAVMGSPLYMSPEQMLSARDADMRSDIWAIGVILYELLAGRPPFHGTSLPEVCARVTQYDPPPLDTTRTDVPPEVAQVITKCLHKNRDRRFQNVGELALALVHHAPKSSRLSVERITRIISAAGLSSSALNLPPSSQDVVAGKSGNTEANWGSTHDGLPKRRRAALWFGAGVGLIALAAAAVWLKALRSADSVPEPTTASAAVVPPDAPSSMPASASIVSLATEPATQMADAGADSATGRGGTASARAPASAKTAAGAAPPASGKPPTEVAPPTVDKPPPKPAPPKPQGGHDLFQDPT